jgi:hypothetical protein
MTECITPVGWGHNGKTGEYYQMPCKKWNCPICGRILKNKLLDRVNRGFWGEEVRFMTLTHKAGLNRDIMKDWNRFRTYLKGETHSKLKYFLTKEFTKKGTRHLHVLVNTYIEQKLIQKCWLKATQGTSYIVWINDAKCVRDPAAYMMKYMTKNMYDEHQYGKREPRYAFSTHKEFRPIKEDKDTSECEIHELEPHFNIHSKYWFNWYNEMQTAYGTPFINWIERETRILKYPITMEI